MGGFSGVVDRAADGRHLDTGDIFVVAHAGFGANIQGYILSEFEILD